MWIRSIAVSTLVALLVAGAGPGPAFAGSDRQDPPRLDGYSGQYTLLRPVRVARLTPFRTAKGGVIDLSRFRGKVVLLNFWATWCVPCVHEMPSLDRLAAEMAGDNFAVVPVAIDATGLAAVAPFYRAHGLDNLDIYLDPDQRTAYQSTDNPHNAEFALYGLPVSYIIDRRGRIRGYIAGAVDWHSGAAKELIRYYLEQTGD